MSVWRIKNVDDKTRGQAQSAAEQAGMPLGAWLERAIMRRIDVAKKADPGATESAAMESSAPETADSSIVAPLTADASERIAPATGKRRKRKSPAKKRAATESAIVEPVEQPLEQPPEQSTEVAPASASAMTSSAPVMVARAHTPEASIEIADAVVPPTDTPTAEHNAVDVLPADEPVESPSIFAAQPEEPSVDTVAPDAVASDAVDFEPSTPQAARRGISLLPVLTIAGLIAIIVVGGFFLFVHDDNDTPSVAQNPPAAGNTASTAKPAPAPSTPTPTPTTAVPTVSPAVAPPTATPPANKDVANPPPVPALPPGVPAPRPGFQPSLLMPVPGANADTPPVAMAPPAADFPNRPGPVVAQQANISSLIERAQGGDVDAQVELGKRYMQGTGADQKPAEALRWLEKAAEAGNGQAQFNVAVMYERGIGTTVDPIKAEAWYRKAATQPVPVPTAIHNLALLYATGAAGIKADPVRARTLMTQSAELGLPESQISLALMYYQGVGGPADNIAALSWLALPARANNAQAIQGAQQLVATMSEADKAKAQQLANQHVKRINDNMARLRAIATGTTPPVVSPPAPDKPLDRAAIVEIQKLLSALKLFTGPADGSTGPKTEQAIRDYQTMAGLPIDGKATAELLTSLRDVAGAVTSK